MNSSFCILAAVDLIAVLVGLFIFPQPKNKWVEQAKVVRDAGSDFGRAMAINGNIAAIASPGDGTVHIYTQSGIWSLQASLSVPPTQPGSYSFFGSSVAIDGNSVLVAADSLNWADSLCLYSHKRKLVSASSVAITLTTPSPNLLSICGDRTRCSCCFY